MLRLLAPQKQYLIHRLKYEVETSVLIKRVIFDVPDGWNTPVFNIHLGLLDPVSHVLLNGLSFPSPSDVIRSHIVMTWRAMKSHWTTQKNFWTECIGQTNDLELISTVKMEPRYPAEGYSGNEFASVCNHCGVMAAWSRKTLKNVEFFLFLEKRPLMGKLSKFCSERIHHFIDSRDVFKFREIWLTRNR